MNTPAPANDLAAKIMAAINNAFAGDRLNVTNALNAIAAELAPTLDALAAARREVSSWITSFEAVNRRAESERDRAEKAEAACAALRLALVAAQHDLETSAGLYACDNAEGQSLFQLDHPSVKNIEAALQATDAGKPLLDELARLRAERDASKKLIREYTIAVAELCGWSVHAIDDEGNQCYWRNEDRSVPTVDSLEQIGITPDDAYGALTAWKECRQLKEAAESALRLSKEDGERLDWLSDRLVRVSEALATKQPIVVNYVPSGYGLDDDAASLRICIDAARQKLPEVGKA